MSGLFASMVFLSDKNMKFHRVVKRICFLACMILLASVSVLAAEPDTDPSGEDLAVLLPLQWETGILGVGAKAFLDADYSFAEIPQPLCGKSFIRTNFFGTRKICLHSGTVYAITPVEHLSEYSLAAELKRRGFQAVEEITEFTAFGDQWEGLRCRVFAKNVQRDERIDLPTSAVVLKSYPTKKGARPPHARESGASFLPRHRKRWGKWVRS